MFKSRPDTLYARRVSRVVFGLVLSLFAGAFVWALLHERGFFDPRDHGQDYALFLLLAWGSAIAAGTLAKWIARGVPRPDGGNRLLAWSLVLPSIGMALLLPLTLHMPFAILLGGLQGFDEWCLISVPVVGAAHVTLLVLMVIRALQLAHGKSAIGPSTVYFTTVLVSCIPFIIFFAIPPILVLATGLPFPALMRWSERIAERERDAPNLPMAMLVSA